MEETNLNVNDFLFTKFITGIRNIPYNTTILLVNNSLNESVDLVYQEGDQKIQKSIPKNTIHGITYTSKIRTSISERKIEDNSTKSALLSMVLFHDNALLEIKSC